MKAALAIAAAELRALRIGLLAGVLFGFLGHVIFTWFRGAFARPGPLPSPELLSVMAVVPVISMQLGLAAVFGASAVSRDLAERRLGFYLARPISPLAYWGAKLVAAFLVAYVSGWLLLAAGFVLGPVPLHLAAVRNLVAREWTPLQAAAATAFMVAFAAAAAGAVRSRSGLLLLDITMLLVTASALVAVLGRSWDEGTADLVLFYGTRWMGAAAFLLLLAASAAQVSLGRLDLRRGHASLSAILWTGLLACVAGLMLFDRAVAGGTPADLRLGWINVGASPAGTRVLLE